MKDEGIIARFIDEHKTLIERWSANEFSDFEFLEELNDITLDAMAQLREYAGNRVMEQNMRSILGDSYVL